MWPTFTKEDDEEDCGIVSGSLSGVYLSSVFCTESLLCFLHREPAVSYS